MAWGTTRWAGAVVVALALLGCGEGSSTYDAAVIDARDAAMIDAAMIDAPMIDAPMIDAPDVDAAIDAATDAPIDAPDLDAAIDAPVDAAIDAFEPDAAIDAGTGLPPLGPGVSTLTGDATDGYVDGVRGVARLSNPVNVAADATGGTFVCDFDNARIRHVAPDGTTSTAGVAYPPSFVRPFGLVRRGDALWIQSDRSTAGAPTGSLWHLTISTGALTLVRDDFGRYRGLAALSDGRLVGADYQRHVISVIDPITGIATPLAGTVAMPGLVDDVGAAARFRFPFDLVVLSGDELVVADLGNHVLRKVLLDGTVTTYAGDSTAGTADGPRLAARFLEPLALAVDATGAVYVGDPGAGTIRRVTATAVTTVAGSGVPGFADATNPLAARFFGLEGLDVSSDGTFLYVADGTRGEPLPYHRVRRVTLP